MTIILMSLLLMFAAGTKDAKTKEVKERSQDIKRLQSDLKDLKQQVKTTYKAVTGRPAVQSIFAKGLHTSQDQVKLTAGRALIQINTSIAEGKQDVSFSSKDSYSGQAWSTDSTNTKTYVVVPLSSKLFLIRSSDTTDASTVNYRVTGD